MVNRNSIFKGILALSVLFVFFTGTGCSLLNKHGVDQEADLEMVRELLAPLYSGQEALIHTLAKKEHELIIFRIENNAVNRIKKKGSAVWNNKNIIFFKTQDSDKKHAFYYLDQTSFQLIPLSTEETGSGDVKDFDQFSLFKSLSHHSVLPIGNHKQSLIKISFEYNPAGEIHPLKTKIIDNEPGDDFLPVYLRKKGRVYFLNRNEQEPAKLMSVNAMGTDRKQHLKNKNYHINRIFTEDGKTIVLESDKKGYQWLYRLGPDNESITEYHSDNAQKALNSPYLLSSRYEPGGPLPVIVKLPDTIDLKTIAALVSARNAGVNLKRSLFAAELVQSGMAKLSTYPSFNFELGTTSPTEILNNQRKFLSGTLINGLFGLIQPLFEIRRNTELGRAAQLTAESFKHQIDNEINERTAEAIQLYFEIHYLNKMTKIWDDLVTIQLERVTYYSNLMKIGDTYSLQLLAANKIVTAGKAEMSFNRDRAVFLLSRLKNICGLSPNTNFNIINEAFQMDESFFQQEDGELKKMALLNHPRLKIIANEFKKAYFLESAGPDIRGKLNIAAEYEYSGRSLNKPVTDNINLTLSGSISTAHGKATSLHKQYWKNIKESLHLRHGITADQITLALGEALMDYNAAKNDYLAKHQDAFYYLEKIRVNRLYHLLEPANETAAKDPLRVATAIQEYLSSIQRLYNVKKDLGMRYVNVWREAGLSKQIPENIDNIALKNRYKTKPSLWLWQTKDVISSPSKIADFTAFAKAVNIKRVYTYLYSDARLLSNLMPREKFTLFLNACAAEGIEVWALLGEPEWLKNPSGTQNLNRGLQRIIEYNKLKNRFEPKIAGLKLDLEPHSIQGWETDIAIRTTLNNTYLTLLETAKTSIIDSMPLWVDCPVKYFLDPKNENLITEISGIADGITSMVYFNSPDTIVNISEKVLNKTDCPTEIGIEFSGKAATSDTLNSLDQKNRKNIIKTITNRLFDFDTFRGLSLHDYSAFKTLTGYEQGIK